MIAYEVTCYYHQFAASLHVVGLPEHYIIDIKIRRFYDFYQYQ